MNISTVVKNDHWLARLVLKLPEWCGRIESVRVGSNTLDYVKVGFWS